MTDNPFRRLWTLGYRRLCPITPPGCPVSERSSLHKRLQHGDDARGKAPGVRWPDGNWSGFDWLAHDTSESDLDRWAAMGAGVGIKTGLGVALIDADTLNPEHAAAIETALEQRFGKLPLRVGQPPKAGYVIRTDEDFQYARVEFGERDAKGRLKDRVEILSEGRQFVAHGIHPKTGKPYQWLRPLPALDGLPYAPTDALMAFLGELAGILPAASEIVQEGSARDVDQARLLGDMALVRKAVEATPNTSETFPTRESWVKYGYAIRGAAGEENDAEGLALFEDFSARWIEGDNPPDAASAEWGRMKRPVKLGADYLYEIAERTAPGKFSRAEKWFEAGRNDGPLFPEVGLNAFGAKPPEPIHWIDLRSWHGVKPPERQWHIEGWVPKEEVTLLYGDGGIGKTLLFQQAATALAASVPWVGQPTQKSRVLCFLCEDKESELHRRQETINETLGVSMLDVADNLKITSRRHHDNMLAMFDRNSNAMKLTALWHQVRADALAFRADVLILDTLADIYSGSENDRSQVNTFVKACLGRLIAETGATVVTLGHPSVSGKTSGSGTSGSTGWSNAVRSRLYLRYPKGVDKGDFRELEGMKSNYGARGNLLKLRWRNHAFELLASSVAPVRRADDAARYASVGEADGGFAGTGVASVADMAADAVMLALQARAGTAMNMKPNSHRYAPKLLKRLEPETLEAIDHDEIAAALDRLERQGWITLGEVGRDKSRRPVEGFLITPQRVGMSIDAGVFE